MTALPPHSAGDSGKSPLSQDSSGQASFFILAFVVVFIFLFQFVVNVGLLIHAKINLQNAADMAAYSGAAVQARQLNQVAFLNYEMRRNFKKFLFRYYVIGGMFQDSLLDPAQSPNSERQWKTCLNPNDPGCIDLGVPAVCVQPGNTAYCRRAEVPRIASPNLSPQDSINEALLQQLENLQGLVENHCKLLSRLNSTVLSLWLFNTEHDLETFESSFAKLDCTQGASPKDREECNEIKRSLGFIKTLGLGMGLVPKNLLLRFRIKTLSDYLNYRPPNRALTKTLTDQLERSVDPAAAERSIAAFRSAYHTAGEHTFDADNPDRFVLEELMPEGSQNNLNVIQLQDLALSFLTYFVAMEPSANQGCLAFPYVIPVVSLPIGVSKDPSTLTYYAVKLTAKVKLLYSPFGDVELKAYAAAQPFGSKLGPAEGFNTDKSEWRMDKTPAAILFQRQGGGGNSLAAEIFRQELLKLSPNDPGLLNVPHLKLTDQLGWSTNQVIRNFYSLIFDQNTINNRRTISYNTLQRAYWAAMAPNPAERGRYTIPNDLTASPQDPLHERQGDTVMQFFDTDGPLQHSFWAPVFPPGQDDTQSIRTAVEEELKRLTQAAQRTQGDPNAGVNASGALSPQLTSALIQGLQNSIEKMRQGGGEDGEGLHIARIHDPYFYRDQTNQRSRVPLSEPLLMGENDIPGVRSSWTTEKNGRANAGRVGYSVKVVAFDALLKQLPGLTSNGRDSWSNLPSDADLDSDRGSLRH